MRDVTLRFRFAFLALVLLGCVTLVSIFPSIFSSLISNLGYLNWLYVDTSASSSYQKAVQQWEYASFLWGRAIQVYPGNVSALRGLGLVALSDNDEKMAMVYFRQSGLTLKGLIYNGDGFSYIGRFNRAIAWYDMALQWKTSLQLQNEIWYKVALAYEGMQEWENALRAFQVVVNHSNNLHLISSAYYHVSYLLDYRIKPRDPVASKTAIQSALALSDFLSHDECVQAHFLYAELLFKQNQVGQAFHEYATVLRLSPTHFWSLVMLGRIYYWTYRDFDSAVRTLQRAVRVDPSSVEAYLSLAYIYEDFGCLSQAQSMYRHVLILSPGDLRAKSRLNSLKYESNQENTLDTLGEKCMFYDETGK